jgi:hypothetical protein
VPAVVLCGRPGAPGLPAAGSPGGVDESGDLVGVHRDAVGGEEPVGVDPGYQRRDLLRLQAVADRGA